MTLPDSFSGSTGLRAALAGLTGLAVLLIAPPALDAQYFGRNKVQYERFDFRIMETARYDIYFYPETEDAVRDAARMAERWHDRLSGFFKRELGPGQPVILYADHPDFQQTNVIDVLLGEGTGGLTESLKNRVVMPLTGSYADTDHVLGHELVHAFQYELDRTEAGSAGGLGRLPLWIVEGLAEYLSLGPTYSHSAMWLRDALIRDELPTPLEITRDPRYFPYRFGHAFWAYVGGRWGDEKAGELYLAATRSGWEAAIRGVLEVSPDSMFREWNRSVHAAYAPLLEGRSPPAEVGTRIVAPEAARGRMNLAPAISPDGRQVIFLSERDLFAIELYLADAHTGEVRRRLASADRSPHFDALSFTHSAGSWSPDGRRFAFVVFSKGRNEIAILDVERGDVRERIGVPGVGAISDPAWSPDGRRLAFSGMAGGISDIYTLELESRELRRLTADLHSARQPAWSPDGSRIAFVSDRSRRTDFDRLAYGPPGIVIADVASGHVEPLELFPEGKHINPAFSPDGASVYFVADADGFADLFRVDLVSGRVYRLTRAATGVSGLTSQSAALSVAAQAGRIAFSVFDGGGYGVHVLAPDDAAGEEVCTKCEATLAGARLPPLEPVSPTLVASYLDSPGRGLPAEADFPVRDYRPGLSLDYVGPVSVGVGVNRFGALVGGSASLFFSDMLGNRRVGAALEAGGSLKDVGGQLFYQDLERRWDLGAGVAHIPYRTGFTVAERRPTGEIVYTQYVQRLFVSQAMGTASYPFSTTRRAEFTGGVTRLGFETEVERFLASGGRIMPVDRERPAELQQDPLYLAQAAAALVHDNSFFAFTSPVRGSRWRLEVQPSLGTFNFATLLGDYRRYHFRRPVTLAYRGLHLGRYGGGAEDERLTPLFVGYETLVRGYASHSFELAECSTIDEQGLAFRCPEFDRLLGSRLAVANLELRLPLFGVEEYGLVNFPFIPIELAAFVDGGVAWTASESPRLAFETESPARVPVFSTGVSARFAMGGYLVLEVYYAHPFQRPVKGRHFGIQIAPGW